MNGFVRSAPERAAMLIILAAAVFWMSCVTAQPVLEDGKSGYLVLATALAQNHGYRDIHYIDRPAHIPWPPVLPFLQAPIVAWKGLRYDLFKILSVLLGIAGLVVLARLMSRRCDPLQYLCLIGLTAVSASTLRYTQTPWSEIPYLLLSLTALLAFSDTHNRFSARSRLVQALLLTLTCMTRLLGLCLAFAVAWWILADQKHRPRAQRLKDAAVTCLPAFVFTGLWCVRALRIDRFSSLIFYTDMVSEPFSLYARTFPNVGAYALTVVKNVYALVFYIIPQLICGINFHGPTLPAVILSGLTGFGALISWRKSRQPAERYCLVYTVTLLLWTATASRGERYFFALLPFALLYFLRGSGLLLESIIRKTAARQSVAALLAVALLISNTLGIMRLRREQEARDAQAASLVAAAGWIKANTPPTALMISLDPAALFLLTDRLSRRDILKPSGKPAKAFRTLSDGYLVDSPLFGPFFPLRELAKEEPHRFVLQYKQGDVTVYRIRRASRAKH